MTHLTLTESLTALGYTHRPAALQGRRDVLDPSGAVVCSGTAEEVWAWVHERQRELWAAGILSAKRVAELIAEEGEEE